MTRAPGSRANSPLLQAERRLQLVIDNIGECSIMMLDPEGVVETWNRGAELILGYPAHEILGKRFDLLYTPDDRAANKPASLLAQARERGRIEDEGWRVRRDGTGFWASVVIAPARAP